jgi:hypothetical protein
MNIKEWWYSMTNPVNAKELARRELEDARRSYLTHKTHQDYYTALVTDDNQRIARLEKYLEEPKGE